jgi:DNA-binding response OmpR family regulator
LASSCIRLDNGDDALASLTFSNDSPKLALPDLNLFGGDGLDILRAIRSNRRLVDVPVAILTSSDAARDKNRASIMGAACYITKPPELESFIADVGGAIRDLLSANHKPGSSTNSRGDATDSG